jgi:uncharacterized protein (DUF1778 family)
MAKNKDPKTGRALPREQSVTLRLSAQEYQLIAYAASKSNIRGLNVWMRTKLLDAAKEKLSDKVATDILAGNATTTLLKESLAESKKSQKKADVVSLAERRKK